MNADQKIRVYLRLSAALFVFVLSASTVDTFRQAVKDLEAGNYAAAEKGFREVLQAVPDHPGAMLNLGVVYSREERYDDAIGLYRAVLKTKPEEKSALANLGVALVKRGSYADAVPVFRKLAQVNPESTVLRDADLMYRLASHQNIEDLLHGETRNQVLCHVDFDRGRFDEAGEECRAAGAHRELGKVLVSQHSPDAESELRIAERENANDPEVQYYLGVALMQNGQTAAAVPYLERAMHLNSGFWGTYFYLGRARMDLGQSAAAVPLLRRASELNPRAATVFYELGRALTATGKPADARQAMQRVRELRAQEVEADAQALRKR